MTDQRLQSEMGRLIKVLYKTSEHARKESRASLIEGARILVRAAKDKAPVGDRIRKIKSGSVVVAEYHPRNLRNSIRTLSLRRTNAVFVGPTLAKTGRRGVYKGNRADGYYAHFVEFGTVEQPPEPFMRPTAEQYGRAAIETANKSLAKKVNNFARKYEQVRGR